MICAYYLHTIRGGGGGGGGGKKKKMHKKGGGGGREFTKTAVYQNSWESGVPVEKVPGVHHGSFTIWSLHGFKTAQAAFNL
jgi:hypothetical protein